MDKKWRLTKPGFASLLRKRIALFIRLARRASIDRINETQYLVGQADAVSELARDAGIISYQQYEILLAASNTALVRVFADVKLNSQRDRWNRFKQ